MIRLAAAAAAAGSAAWTLLLPHPARAEEPPRKSRVLVVGAGLTGCLTAAFLRRRAQDLLDITVYERASYPSGRFGAIAEHGGAIADVGAQVLSVVDPDDPRAREGHGATVEVLHLAFLEASRLEASGLLVEADPDRLCPTEERLNWEGLWRHFFAPSGLASVLAALLDEARASVFFGKKLVALGAAPAGIFATDSEGRTAHFDAAVVAVPAFNALNIGGLAALLRDDPLAATALERVRYDARTCHALFLSPELGPRLEALFGEVDELCLSDDLNSYMSFQGRKRAGSEACVVVHGPARAPSATGRPAASDDGEETLASVARLLGLTRAELDDHTLHQKTIDWTLAQTSRPLEAVLKEVPRPPVRCLRGPRVFVAGDFLTHASYIGCVSSADAAAAGVLKLLE